MTTPPIHLIAPPGPRWLRRVITAAGVLYLSAIVLGSAGSALPRRVLPRPVLFCSQVACLFPHAARVSIDYRVLAYSCEARRWQELDHRPYFPIRHDDKESRFHRVAHFYRRNRKTMQALEAYLVSRHNERASANNPSDGAAGRIGGIALFSLRVPFPRRGGRVDRYRRTAFRDHPRERRKRWYITPSSRRHELCEGVR